MNTSRDGLRIGNLHKKFHIGIKIGCGSFGDIYLGSVATTGEEVAIKLESVKWPTPQLLYEAKIYKMIHGGVGIPNIRWHGNEGDYNVMVLDLLGPTLEDLFNYCSRKFSLKTVLMLADQMLDRLEYVHGKSLIHRDLKPDNFLIGLGRNQSLIHIIDFGLSKKYRNPRTHEHIPYRDSRNLTGTARYVSINTHVGSEQARRDDLESVGYILLYFLRGSLPWQSLKANNKKLKYDRIRDKKLSTTLEQLCKGYPQEFKSYLEYCRSLSFTECPNYAYLKGIFSELFRVSKFQYDNNFDWTILHSQASRRAAPRSNSTVYSSQKRAAMPPAHVSVASTTPGGDDLAASNGGALSPTGGGGGGEEDGGGGGEDVGEDGVSSNASNNALDARSSGRGDSIDGGTPGGGGKQRQAPAGGGNAVAALPGNSVTTTPLRVATGQAKLP